MKRLRSKPTSKVAHNIPCGNPGCGFKTKKPLAFFVHWLACRKWKVEIRSAPKYGFFIKNK